MPEQQNPETFVRLPFPSIVLSLFILGSAPSAHSQECKPDDVFGVIDATGARLREINSEWQPRLTIKMRELAARNGWSDADAEVKGNAVLVDSETQRLDGRAAELLADIDRLGDDTRTKLSACERLAEVRTKSSQLAEVTVQRASHVIARIDIALKPAAAPTVQPPSAAAQPPARQFPSDAKQAAASPPAARTPPPPAWQTTVRDSPPSTPPPVIAEMAPAPDPASLGYSPEEIRVAGRGFFGSISAGLASVIDYAFQTFGRPTGYVLGDEGGGAFVAGLRYGQGRLVTKLQGERKVFWQGPSAGLDFGVTGSQVMFLVYNVEDQQQLFQRFTGVDGSAYLVGGVGITFLKRGNVILAPIRTGLGLRIGANLGYLKFTPTHSYNPF